MLSLIKAKYCHRLKGKLFYKVSEIQKWIDDNLLEPKITPVNETINLLDSPKKILCLGKIIGSEENQSAKLSTIEDKI